MKRAVIALALLLASPARGEMEWFWDNQTSPSLAIGTVVIVNDNSGATYDSYTLFLEDLAGQVWNANIRLHGVYSNLTTMIAEGLHYNISPIVSEVDIGWTSTVETNGQVEIVHGSGDPFIDYDVWLATPQDPSLDQQVGTFSISKTLLDLDGDGWSAGEDLVIENDTNQVVLLGVGHAGIDQFEDYAPRPVVRVGGERGKVAGLALDGLACTSLVAGAEVSIEEWRMECWSNGVVECWSTQSTFTATGKVQQFAVPMTNDSGWFRLRMQW